MKQGALAVGVVAGICGLLASGYWCLPEAMSVSVFITRFSHLVESNFDSIAYSSDLAKSELRQIENNFGRARRVQSITRIINPKFSYPTMQLESLIERSRAVRKEFYTFTVDAAGHLVLIGVSSASTYDGDGLRRGKVMGVIRTTFVWGGSDYLQERS